LEVIHINPLMAIVGTVFSMVVITLALLQFQWVKTYAGPYRMAVRTAVALGVALAIASIHFVFDAAFYEASIGLIDVNTNSKITAIAVALGMVCLFLIAFMLVLFYEKHGKQLFNLNLFQSSPDKKVKEYSLQDSLTKLPNRRAFDSHLESAEKRCARSGKSFALAYIDLDHSTIGAFKAPIFVSAPFRAIHPRELCLSLSLLSSSPSQNFHHHTIKS
jgi:predicted signal transduction protein with EAL and GGDEF domain